MNELQKKEFELLRLFVEICDKLSLKYYLVCGSALGAVKYNGFIPWDDDIDVGMPRKDYEIFLCKAQALLPDNIFLQNYRTDKAFPHVFSKLRNSDTAFIEKSVAHLDINQGINMDIFPLDGYPADKISQNILRYRKKFLSWQFYSSLNDKNQSAKIRLRNKIMRFLGCHKRTDKALARLDKMISKYPADASDIWCNHGNWQGELEYAPRWHYGEGTKAVFEGLEVIVPEKFDDYLTQKYGDWRSDPPPESQKSHHIFELCDTEKSYKEYLKNYS